MCHRRMSSQLSLFEPASAHCAGRIKTHQVCFIYSSETCKLELLIWCIWSLQTLMFLCGKTSRLGRCPKTPTLEQKFNLLISLATFNSWTKPKIFSTSLQKKRHATHAQEQNTYFQRKVIMSTGFAWQTVRQGVKLYFHNQGQIL